MKCVQLQIVLLLASVSGFARGDIIDVLVPAYANPCCGGGPNMWSSLIETAESPSRNFQLHAVFNPASGPGSMRDPNYLNGSGAGPLNDFRNAGGITIGYVATGFGSRSLAGVKSDVDAYLTGHYAGFIDGIFFDEMSNDLANVGYYQELNNYVKANQAGARTYGNPGTTFVNNTSGQSTFSASDYIDSLDTIITFENSGTEYANNYTSFPHVENLDRQKIGHIVHTQATWDPSILDTVSARGAGFLYITDDMLPPDDNPYDTLTSYWPQLTADVSSFNAVPEPSSAALLASAGIAFVLRRKFRRTKRSA